MQSQIKETKSLVEVIDLGNKLVYKEYQKMSNENTVNSLRFDSYSSSREIT